jgi:hypothetical protein
MIETIWDLTSQQLPKLANNQNLTTKPLQIHNGTNTSPRTKLPNIFLNPSRLHSSPDQMLATNRLTEFWVVKRVQRLTQSSNSQIRGRGRYHPTPTPQPCPRRRSRSRSGKVYAWKKIHCCNWSLEVRGTVTLEKPLMVENCPHPLC